MAVKIADTLKALSNTFPVAECVDIDVNINGTTKRLQKAIDDGEIGGGSDSTWKGTHEEWEALSTEEKGKYEVICFTDDYDGSDSTWKGTHEEWEALSTEEKGKYEVVYFTDDYDGSGICGSDSIWKGTRDEWEALLTAEKQKYVIVYFTDDYNSSGDGTGLIDDTNASGKTTYSSTKIENSLSKKANSTDLTAHTSDTNIHVTTSDKTKWNKVDNKIDKTDIVDNLTSTNTDKPLSAKQGKVLKDDIGLKANTTDLTAHTGNTGVHITTAERTKWNEVDNKVKKTDIITATSNTVTNEQVYGAFIMNTMLNNKDNIAKVIGEEINVDTTTANIKGWCVNLKGTTPNGSTAGWFSNEYVNSTTINQKFISYYKTMYIRSMFGETWSKWAKVCTTSVVDVPKTNITLNNGFTGVAVSYEVKNGVCYVNIEALKSEKTGQDLIVSDTLLPKPSIGVVTSTINFDRTDAKTGMVYIETNSENKLIMHCYKANTDGWCTFSYPVAES